MEFEGTVYKIMPVTKGTSARGEWQRQDVVFEMNEGSFTRKICVTFFNKPDDVARLREGAAYTVSVNIESREYNGRWYTDIRAWRIQPKQETPAGAPMPDMPPIAEEPAYASAPAEATTCRSDAPKNTGSGSLPSGRGSGGPGKADAADDLRRIPSRIPGAGRCVPGAAVRTAPNRLRSSANAPGPENPAS